MLATCDVHCITSDCVNNPVDAIQCAITRTNLLSRCVSSRAKVLGLRLSKSSCLDISEDLCQLVER